MTTPESPAPEDIAAQEVRRPTTRQRLMRWLKLGAKVGITAAIFYLLFTKLVKLDNVWALLVSASKPWLLLALVLFIVSKLLGALRLNYYFRSIGLRLTEGANWRLYLLGMYYNLFLPGGLGGDAYKLYLLNQHQGVRKRDLFWPLLLDRVSGLAALFALLFVFLLFVPLGGYLGLNPDLEGWLRMGLAIAGPLMYAAYYLAIHFFWLRFKRVFLPTLFYSVVLQAAQVGAAWCVLHSMVGDEKPAEYMALFLLSSIASVLPVTIGGLGSREIVFSWGAAQMQADPNKAVVIGLVFYLISSATSLTGIYYSYRPVNLKNKAV